MEYIIYLAVSYSAMKILFVNVPSRAGPGGLFSPMGLLYAAGACMRAGHEARIHDLYLDPDPWQAIGEFNPDIIGFGGIATSYGRFKALSAEVRERCRGVRQIVGGPLASCLPLIYEHCKVNAIFTGEGEVSLPAYLNTGLVLKDVPQVELDTIPLPPYDLIDPSKYLTPDFPVMASRGCTHRCLFCYRHMQGHRQHSVGYVMKHLDFLYDEFGITRFNMADELFNRDKNWVMAFAKEMENRNYRYRLAGARVDLMDEEMIWALKESGCTQINYGQESGSDKILAELRKGTTVAQNVTVTRATRRAGIDCPVQLVIGSPSETRETIRETARFLEEVGERSPSVNYLTPFPGSPIWLWATGTGRIRDQERYLDTISKKESSSPVVNLTQEPYLEWRLWGYRLKKGWVE